MKKTFILLILVCVFLFLSTTYPTFAQQSATTGGDPVRDIVKQKIEEAKKNPKAFIGIITDKSETNLQIRLESGEIGQISTDSSTTYLKADKTSAKISFTEIAIGDTIVAMGYKNTNGILSAKRILLYIAPLTPVKRQIIKVKVTNILKNQLTVIDRMGTTMYITPAANIVVTSEKPGESKKSKYAVIKENDTLIAIGDVTNNLLEARRIYLYPANPSPTNSPTPTPKLKISPILTPTPKIKSSQSPTPTPGV